MILLTNGNLEFSTPKSAVRSVTWEKEKREKIFSEFLKHYIIGTGKL